MAVASAYVRELCVVTEATKKWRQYLLGKTFKIFTDHKSLKSLLTQTIQTPEQQKWLIKLMGYQYEIHYKPKKENVVANALSLMPKGTPDSILATISFPTSPLFDNLKTFYTENLVGQTDY